MLVEYAREVAKAAVDIYGMCRKRIMKKSVQCLKCEYWVDKESLNIKEKLINGINYECGKCRNGVNDEKEKCVKLGRDEIEIVKEFCYLIDMLGKYNSISKAVASRIRAGWKKFKEENRRKRERKK